jgi:hypothetical protein
MGNTVIDISESAADALAKDITMVASAQETSSARRITSKLARFKLKRKPAADDENVSARKATAADDAKPRRQGKRAAQVADKRSGRSSRNSKTSKSTAHVAGGRMSKKAARLADKKMRAQLQLTKPRSIMVEERRRSAKSGRG